jgi:hypothetical protein
VNVEQGSVCRHVLSQPIALSNKKSIEKTKLECYKLTRTFCFSGPMPLLEIVLFVLISSELLKKVQKYKDSG